MYVPPWQGLDLGQLSARASAAPPYPIDARGSIAFYRARVAIYHLFRALRLAPGEAVLAPDYHSGSEIAAIRAAGCSVRLYAIDRHLRPNLEQIEALSRGARVLFVIHYLGWPQPLEQLQEICDARGMILVEDCALSLFSRHQGRPLGSFGDYAFFCLYKTLPVPTGGLLVQNRNPVVDQADLKLRSCSGRSIAGRTFELLLEHIRSRADGIGAGLFAAKRTAGRALNRLRVARQPVGDIGFCHDDLLYAMSPFCLSLLRRFSYASVIERRRANYASLDDQLGRVGVPLFRSLDDGVCPLFFPMMVRDKASAAATLRAHGIEAVEFWNAAAGDEAGEDASFLRRHVIEIPIHQGLTSSHIDHVARTIRRHPGLFSFDEARADRRMGVAS